MVIIVRRKNLFVDELSFVVVVVCESVNIVNSVFKAVDLLPPMSPLSFDPVSEEVYEKSVLLKYPASLPGW